MKNSRIYILFLLLLAAFESYSQRIPIPGGGGGISRGSSASGILVRDTSDIYYFHAGNPSLIYPFGDSTLVDFHQYDPIRRQDPDYAHLGNFGSAHRPLFYQPAWRRGFDVGLHQFDLYQKSIEDVRFYKITQAYTQAGYSQGTTQEDAYTEVLFSRNFADGLNLSLEHHRINNAGPYDHQKAVNSNVSFGLWYHNEYGNYDGFLTFVTNSITQEDNGGIMEGADTFLIDAFQVDVNLQNSNTRYANREYAYTQYFYLNNIFSGESVKRRADRKQKRKVEREKQKAERELAKKLARDSTLQDSLLTRPDSLTVVDSLKNQIATDSLGKKPGPTGRPATGKPAVGPTGKYPGAQPPTGSPGRPVPPGTNPQLNLPEGRTFTLYHQVAWRSDSYKFSALPSDSLYFADFWVDDRGLRHYLEKRKLENTVKLQTFKLRPQISGNPSERSLPQESDLLEVGLVHSLHLLDQEPVDTGAIHNLFLTGRLNFSPSDRLRIQTYAHLGLAANAGDFRLGGVLFLNFKKIGNLRLEAVNQLYSPSLLQQRFYVSGLPLWSNNFDKTLQTSWKGTYSLPLINFSVTGQYHLVTNLVYFDTDGRPQQEGSAINIFQLQARKDFHLAPLHLENWVGLQESTSDKLRLPTFYSTHSLYLETKIFKKVMLTRIGLDARLTTGYSPYAYQPLTGQFHLQNEQSLPFTPLIDAFLSFKVKTFRFYMKIDNILPGLTGEYYFQTADHPLPYGFGNGGLRLGVNWRLVD